MKKGILGYLTVAAVAFLMTVSVDVQAKSLQISKAGGEIGSEILGIDSYKSDADVLDALLDAEVPGCSGEYRTKCGDLNGKACADSAKSVRCCHGNVHASRPCPRDGSKFKAGSNPPADGEIKDSEATTAS